MSAKGKLPAVIVLMSLAAGSIQSLGASAAAPQPPLEQIKEFLACGKNPATVEDCSSKFLSARLSRSARDRISLWLIANHDRRSPAQCDERQQKVICAAGYGNSAYLCLKHASDKSWGFLNYEMKSGSVHIIRLKDR